jgi:mono/diheme cytochrome c family protein
MRKLLIAVLFAGLALGCFWRPALAADNLSKAEKGRLFMQGAQLWPIYCNQCHNARPPGEKTAYEWDQIMIHMRMISNMPADDARAILEFLKASH